MTYYGMVLWYETKHYDQPALRRSCCDDPDNRPDVDNSRFIILHLFFQLDKRQYQSVITDSRACVSKNK